MIKSNFKALSQSAFLAQAQVILAAMTDNADFPEPWPAKVPSTAQIRSDLGSFQTLLTATQAGDRTQVMARDAARETLAYDLSQLAFYVQAEAEGDDSLLATTGFPLRKPYTRSRLFELPAAPEQFRVVRGPVSGMLIVSCRRVKDAGCYDLQITTGDPTVEANWSAVGIFKNCGRISLQGLTPGKVYAARMRALGTAGIGAWSKAINLMVV